MILGFRISIFLLDLISFFLELFGQFFGMVLEDHALNRNGKTLCFSVPIFFDNQ